MNNQIISILNGIRPEFDFSEDVNFIEEGMLDSFDVISLVSELEENFGININGVDILPENISSIENIKSLINKSEKK